MIRIDDATLRIKKIRQSRNGVFCVADLTTEIGEFKVKDPLLDQFEEGEYQATVWITEIFLAQYISYGKSVTELRARLQDLQVHAVDLNGELTETIVEPDPLDEQPARPLASAPSAPTQEAGGRFSELKTKLASIGSRKPKEAPESVSEQSNLALFGNELWAQIQARERVKLDPTIDRAILRKQAALMHQFKFKFNPLEQLWIPQ